MSKSDFEGAVEATVSLYEELIGQPASRTRQMIQAHGEVGALSELVRTTHLQKGFKKLRDRNLLDKTFEALVVRFKDQFDGEVVKAAQWRLDNADELLSRGDS